MCLHLKYYILRMNNYFVSIKLMNQIHYVVQYNIMSTIITLVFYQQIILKTIL